MKVLVTGAAGFIGSHLCDALIKDGHEVIGFDDLSNGKIGNFPSSSAHLKLGSITNRNNYPEHNFDWIFHLAAKSDIVPSIEKPTQYHDVNVNGTLALLEFARRSGCKRFIYAASSSCYGIPAVYPTPEESDIKPMYPYALTKWIGEQYVLHWSKVYKVPALSLRLFNVYGPRSRTSGAYGAVFGVFLAQLANKKPLTVVGNGNQSRDFTYVSDVVDGFIKAAKSNASGLSINLGTGLPQSINQLVEYLEPHMKVHLPDRPGEPRMTMADNGLAKLLLKWEPKISFEQGVKIMKGLTMNYKDAPLWDAESIHKATKPWFEALQ